MIRTKILFKFVGIVPSLCVRVMKRSVAGWTGKRLSACSFQEVEKKDIPFY